MVARFKLDEAPEAKIYLQEWRETKFPTQQALADKIGLKAATISRIETGEREWGKGYLEALAHAVGCKVGDLFRNPKEDSEARLRSALISHGVDQSDLPAVLTAIRGFVGANSASQPLSDQSHDQSGSSNRRHERAPS